MPRCICCHGRDAFAFVLLSRNSTPLCVVKVEFPPNPLWQHVRNICLGEVINLLRTCVQLFIDVARYLMFQRQVGGSHIVSCHCAPSFLISVMTMMTSSCTYCDKHWKWYSLKQTRKSHTRRLNHLSVHIFLGIQSVWVTAAYSFLCYLFKQHKGQQAALQCAYIHVITSVSYTKLLKKIKHEIYKYINNDTKLLFKNYVKLTLFVWYFVS